jgi:hypothetical protein
LSKFSKKHLVSLSGSLFTVLSLSAAATTAAPPAAGSYSSINQVVASSSSSAAIQNLNPTVLKLALNAYKCAAKTGVATRQKLITIIDYSLPSSAKRMWVYDVSQSRVVFNTLVAHGKGSGNVYADRFSNKPETRATSIGLFVTGAVYQGGNGYSLRLNGLEKGYNDLAGMRNIVMHGAAYVNEQMAKAGRIGRSWGCPAVPKQLAAPIINTIKDRTLVFAYYPDQKWLQNSQYLHCDANLKQAQVA